MKIRSQTNTVPGNKLINTGFKGLTATSRKCSRLLPVSCPSFLRISWKSVRPFFCNAAKRHGLLRKSGKKSCVQGVIWNILKMLPIFPCIKSHLPWKFDENPFRRFSVMLLTDRQTNRHSNGQRWKHNLRHGGVNERLWEILKTKHDEASHGKLDMSTARRRLKSPGDYLVHPPTPPRSH